MTSRTSWLLCFGLALSTVLMGCPPSEPNFDPPLRPLIYTTSPQGEPAPHIDGYEMWEGETDPTAYPGMDARRVSEATPSPDVTNLTDPQAVGHVIFRAFAAQRRELLDPLLIGAEEYARAARAGPDTSARHVAEMHAQLDEVWGTFHGTTPSEQRPGGLGAQLGVEQVDVGSYRMVSGERAQEPEDAEMILGLVIVMRLGETDLLLRIRVPKLLRTEAGEWRIAEAPELGGRLQMFLDMGLHLSPALLAFEHYPVPLHTGNYWTYQVRQIPRLSPDEVAAVEHTADETLPRVRDIVLTRDDYNGYSLVRVRREHLSQEERPTQTAYLLTPRRLFRCNRDCRRQIENVDWLLSHLSTSVTPDLVFPLRPGMGWRRGGRLDAEGDHFTWSESEEVTVPAGHFENAVRILHSSRRGRVHRYHRRGLGTILERIDGATTTTFYELVDYRIIP